MGDIRETFISLCAENLEDTSNIKIRELPYVLRSVPRISFVTRTSHRSFLQYTFLRREYAPLCLARLIILSRRLDVTRIFIATDSIFSPEWRGPRSNFTKAAPTPLRHPPPALEPLIFLPCRCLVLALHPYISSCRPTRSHEFPWNYVTPGARAGRAGPTDNYFRS